MDSPYLFKEDFIEFCGGKVKTRDVHKMLEKLLGCFLSESTGSPVLCKKCFSRLERYESTLEEIAKLKESHRKNCEEWSSENIRRKRCVNSPGHGVKRFLQFRSEIYKL